MTDIRVPGDGVPPVKAVLAAHFGTEVDVVDELVPTWDHNLDKPQVVVADDSGPTVWPIMTKPTIRVTCCAHGMDVAKLLRRRAMGAVFAGIVAGLAHIDRERGIGYASARDERTGADLASFTFNATVRTEVITV